MNVLCNLIFFLKLVILNHRDFETDAEIHGSCASHCAKIVGDVKKLSNFEKEAVLNFIRNDPLLGVSRFNIKTVEQMRACIFNVQKLLETSKTNVSQLY